MDPRTRIGRDLAGDVLEVGPGSQPFPTASGARVVYADKSVPGGRDETWPELIGEPWGPRADHAIDLDATGLAGMDDGAFDAVIAAHVIEHVANPVATLVELERVLRPGGRLVLVVPERRLTFDAPRPPTSLAHVLEEHRLGVVVVDDAHIEEFCAAVYAQPPFHPPEVRGWHDPAQLDADRFDLHRRRSIHVHCWSAEEFASLIAGLLDLGLLHLRLVDLYFDDDPGQAGIEFGLVLEKAGSGVPGPPTPAPPTPAPPTPSPPAAASDFVARWASMVLDDPAGDPLRVAALTSALARDLGEPRSAGGADLVSGPATLLAGAVTRVRHEASIAAAERDRQAEQRQRAESATAEVRASRSYRAGSVLTAPVRVLRTARDRWIGRLVG